MVDVRRTSDRTPTHSNFLTYLPRVVYVILGERFAYGTVPPENVAKVTVRLALIKFSTIQASRYDINNEK